MCSLCGKCCQLSRPDKPHKSKPLLALQCMQDPGNLEADLQAGGFAGYALLWLFLVCTIMVRHDACRPILHSHGLEMLPRRSVLQGFAFQCLSSRLGIATGLNLAQHCGQEYPKLPRYLMWFCMEIAIIGADIQEVIGSAIAIALLSNNVIPLWAGTNKLSSVLLLFTT